MPFHFFFHKIKELMSSFFYFYLDWGTWFIGCLTRDFRIFIPYCILLVLAPIYYSPELLSYFEYCHNTGFTPFNILVAMFQFFPWPFLFLMLLFYFFLFLVLTITPLLFVPSLVEKLQKHYGELVLKQRRCNGRLSAFTSACYGTACVICGMDTAGRVLAHKTTVEANKEVSLKTGTPMPPVIYQGAFEKVLIKVAVQISQIREKK